MNPQLAIALLIAAASGLSGFGAAWKVQSWRFDAKEKQHAEQVLADERLAAETAINRQGKVIKAVNASVVSQATLRVAAAKSRVATDGLRDDSARALRDATTSITACIERATTLSELLNAMADAGGQLAEKADRHADDAGTCHAAWSE